MKLRSKMSINKKQKSVVYNEFIASRLGNLFSEGSEGLMLLVLLWERDTYPRRRCVDIGIVIEIEI